MNLIYLIGINLKLIIDHWVPPPASDDRRTPGMRAMNATGQANLNPTTLLNVLSIDPVCNKYINKFNYFKFYLDFVF